LIMKKGRELGTCSEVGRNLIFSEDDLLKIWTALRVPPSSPIISRQPTQVSWHQEDFKWLGNRPPTSVDGRVMGILRWLSQQRLPKTHKQIERAAERTIQSLLAKGLVDDCGVDEAGLTLVKINAAGKEQIEIVERWKRKRAARGEGLRARR
jgi:hypothetical protein